jgi:hypothetical protein
MRYTYTFDSNGNSLTGKCEIGQNGSWNPVISFINLFSDKVATYSIGSVYRYEASYKSFISGIPITQTNNIFLSIYPNPAKYKITLSVSQIQKDQNTILTIFNMQGQILLQQSVHQEKTEIDVSSFVNGIYLLKVNQGDKESATRFLKE